MFAYREILDGVELAFTDRHGGVSQGAYASLNLGLATGDDPAAVETNFSRLSAALGVPRPSLVRMNQVHGTEVAVVDGRSSQVPRADGLVTTDPRVTLCVRAADCAPVLLADSTARVVGCVHAGRPGMVAGVVAATLARMRRLGATDIRAWVGPHICGACYEVPEPMRAEVSAAVPESYAETAWGTPSVDIGAGVRAQLERAGCPVVETGACTREHPDLFSYRRDGPASGRLAGLVRLVA